MCTCPKCGFNNPDAAELCDKCGHPLTETSLDEPIPEELNGSNVAPSALKIKKIVLIVNVSLFLLSLVLLVVGCFGDLIKGFFLDAYDAIPFNYNFEKYFGDNPYGSTYQFEKAFFITQKVLYYIMLGGILVFGTLGIINAVKALAGKKELSTRFQTLTGAVTLPYLFVLSQRMLLTVSQSGVTIMASGYGWGTILLLIGALTSLINAAIFSFINDLKKDLILQKALQILANLCSLIVLILGLGLLISYSQDSYVSGELTLFQMLDTILQQSKASAGSSLTLGISGFIVYALGFILFGTFVLLSLRKTSLIKTILQLVGAIAITIGLMLSAASINEYCNASYGNTAYAGLTTAATLAIVFGFASVALFAASIIIKMIRDRRA